MKHYGIFLKNDHGITLVELMVTMAILSLVLSLGYIIFDFGITSFGRGETKINIQQNLRMVADYIIKEIRLSSEVDILDDMPEEIDEGEKYIIINNDGKLEIKTKEEQIVYRDTLMAGTSFTLNFKGDGKLLRMIIGVEINGEPYDYKIDTQISILNITENITGTGSVLRYK